MKGKRIGDEERQGSHFTFLLVMIGVALTIHLAFMIPVFRGESKLFMWADSFCFERLAVNLLDGNGFSSSETQPYNPNSTITPGYPFFIAGVYSIFGRNPYVVVAIQIVLSIGVALLVIRRGIKENSLKVGFLASILLLLDICLAFYCTQIMSDVLFVSLVVPGFWLTLKLFKTGSWKAGIGAGACFGLAALVRPIGLYLPLAISLLFFLKQPEGSPKRRIVGYALLLLIHVVIVSPWVVRNRTVFGHFFFSTIQSFNLSHIHAAPLKASIEDKSAFDAERELEVAAFNKYGQPENEAERFIFAGREAASYVFAHPLPYLKLYLTGVARTILPMGPGEFRLFYTSSNEGFRNLTPLIYDAFLNWRFGKALSLLWSERFSPAKGVFWLYLLSFLFKISLIVVSIVCFFRTGGFRSVFNLLFLVSTIYFLGVTGPAGQSRHFLPLMPLVALLTARLIFLEKSNNKKKVSLNEE